jgi:hypothetical protein
MIEDDEPIMEIVGIYDNDDRRYGTDHLEVPPLCQTCVQLSAEASRASRVSRHGWTTC